MLVLTRKCGQEIQIGENIILKVVRVEGRRVRIGIMAPNQVQVLRGELTANGWRDVPLVEDVAGTALATAE